MPLSERGPADRAPHDGRRGVGLLDLLRETAGHPVAGARVEGQAAVGGEQYAVQAKEVDAGPLLATLALSDKLAPGLRRWLQASRPVVSLHDVEVAGRRDGPLCVLPDPPQPVGLPLVIAHDATHAYNPW